MIGAWTCFEHMESSLTLEELFVLADTQQQRDHHFIQKMGAIQGVEVPDLKAPKQNEPESFRERVARRARESGGSAPSMHGVGYKQV